jgi:hypothetical protein
VSINLDDLLCWSQRAADDLRYYAEAATESGSPQLETEALIAELGDILAGRETWSRALGKKSSAKTRLDDL